MLTTAKPKVKIALTGHPAAGKSAFIKAVNDGVARNLPSSQGLSVHEDVAHDESFYYQPVIWDSPGQGRMYRVTDGSLFTGAEAIYLFCDLTQFNTYRDLADNSPEKLSNRIAAIKKVRPNSPIILVGTHTDQLDESFSQKETVKAEVDGFCQQQGIVHYLTDATNPTDTQQLLSLTDKMIRLNHLETEIKTHLTQLQHRKENLAKAGVKIKPVQSLEEEPSISETLALSETVSIR